MNHHVLPFQAEVDTDPAPLGLPATVAQRRLWFIENGDVRSPTYNVASAFSITGALDEAALERALAFMQQRHPALRSRFRTRDGELEISVEPLGEVLEKRDLRELDADARQAAIEQYRTRHAHHVFDLAHEAPILPSLLLRLDEQARLLLVNVHHIVCDDWSIRLFFRELGVAYGALKTGATPDLPRFDYTAAASADGADDAARGAAARAYWREALEDAPTLHKMPLDRPRPATPRMRGAVCRHVFDRSLSERMRALCRRHGVTPYMLGVAAFAVLLHRYSGEEQIVIGSPFANRVTEAQQRLIGFFINLIPLRIRFDADISFTALLAQVRDMMLDAFDHARLPFDQIVEAIQPPRSTSHAPLFQIMFDYLKGGGMLALDGATVEGTLVHTGTAKYDLTVSLEETPDALAAIVEYDTDLFDADTAHRLITHFETLLGKLLDAPEARVIEGSMLPAAELAQVRRFTRPDEPFDTLPFSPMSQRFRDAARRAPHALAVVHDTVRRTYADLDRDSDRLAGALRARGVGRGDRVASLLSYSDQLLVSYLGILKAGAVYLPLDPADPRHRDKLDDAGPAAIVTSTRDQAALAPAPGAAVLLLDALPEVAPGSDPAPLTEEDPAYVIYTSGSTGKPKGVEVSHGSLNASYHGWHRAYRFGKPGHPVTLQLAGMTFDLFIGDVSRTLACGGTLVMPPRAWLLDAARLYALMQAERVSLGDFPPVILRELIRHCHETGARLDMLDTLICGADIWFGHELNAARALCGPHARILGSYGVTEAAIDSSYFDPDLHALAPESVVPLGRPLPSCELLIVDPLLQMTPIGVPGELLIAGPAVATRYLGEAALTAQKFLRGRLDAHGRVIVGEGETRFYRTGDICRFLTDGTIDFLGRRDHQIKIRGLRVELGDVESVLAAHPDVRQCAVVVRDDASGEAMLAAFAVSGAAADALRDYLRGRLPAYMVPAVLEPLEAMPLTPSGKVDRNRLKHLPLAVATREPAVREQTPTERRLLALWQPLLAAPVPGVQANFFGCGGHSLAAARLASRIGEQFGVEMGISAIFNHPTVAEQARFVERRLAAGAGASARTGTPTARTEDAAWLSSAQQSLWLHARRHPDDFSYHVPMVWCLDGNLDPDALEQAVNDVVARHEALHTVFSKDLQVGRDARGVATQEPARIVDPSLGIPLRRAAVPTPEAEHLPRLLRAEQMRAFDLHAGPLLRAALFEIGAARHVLSVTVHHIVIDGPSFGLFWRDLQIAYAARRRGEAPRWTPPAWRYADFVSAQRQELRDGTAEPHLNYWREQLRDLPAAIALPGVAGEVDPDGTRSRSFDVPPEIAAGLAAVSERACCSPFITYVALFAVALRRLTGETDFAIGTPVSLRPRQGFDDVLGFFANTLPLRVRGGSADPFEVELARIRDACLALYDHSALPFEHLVQELRPARAAGRNPVFQTIFSYEADDTRLQLAEVDAHVRPLDAYAAKLDLEMAIQADAGRVQCHVMSRPGAFGAAALDTLRDHFLAAARAAARPDAQAVRHAALPDAARADDLYTLFADSAERYPEHLALDGPGVRRTYRQLTDQVAVAAQALRARGVRRGDRVSVFAGHHPHNVTAMLAIACVGAAFVPMDPEHQPQWNRHIVDDAALAAIVCHAQTVDAASGFGPPLVDLDALPATVPTTPAQAGEARSDDCAYVIYTSGSTGLPKGVAVAHRSVCHNVRAMTDIMGVTPASRIVQYVSPVFDVVLGEIFPALLAGAAIVFGERRRLLPGPALVEWLAMQRITHWWIVPSALAMVPEAELPALEVVIVAGETCPAEVARRWAPGRRLLNGYGPTEAAIVVSLTDYHAERGRLILRPMGGAALHVLDDAGQQAEPGVAGELCIGGVCVAEGYLGQPARTATVFVADPAGAPGERMYRTGDKARRLDDGAIQFVGRVDRQVKIRGFRIELDAVRSALMAVPGVQVAEALALPDAQGQTELVGYVVGRLGRPELLAALRDVVPEAMVPSRVVFLDALPKGSTGKVDLKALKALQPAGGAPRSTPAASPRVPPRPAPARTVQRVREIWHALLERDDVADDENFFEAGGHSLRAVALHQRVTEAFGDVLALTDVFDYPTIRTLAARLDALIPRDDPAAAAVTDAASAATDPGADPNAIAIIGLAGRFPEAPDLDVFWQRLLDGYEAGRELDDAELEARGVPPDRYRHPHFVRRFKELEGKAEFDADFFGYAPREAQVMDPQQRIFLELAWQALEHAGHGDQARVRPVGVFAGAAFDYYLVQNVVPNAARLRLEPGQWMIGNDKDFIATRVSYKLNLRGPALSIGTACSSSLMAVHLACASLRNGEAEMALAGGIALDPEQVGYLYSEGGIMSPDGRCRPFDAAAAGTAAGSGGGVVVLKKLDAAWRDGDTVYAVIRGSAANNDGAAKVSYTAPSVAGQAAVIRDALRAAGVPAARIGYVEAHGTGTPLGDPIEVRALAQAFAEDAGDEGLPRGLCGIGSVKGNIGHLDAASGIAGLLKTVLALHRERIPPSINCDTPSARIGFDATPFEVVRGPRAWPRTPHAPRRAGVSSFGVGGTNVHVVLEEAPADARRPVAGPADWQLLPLSARSENALRQHWTQLRRALPDVSPRDAAQTLQLGRTAFEQRAFMVLDAAGDLAAQLDRAGDAPSAFRRRHAPPVVFVFPGQGSQYPGMGAALYRRGGVFAAEVDRCATLLREPLGQDIRRLMFDADGAPLKETRYTQPALFTLEYALARQLRAWGITPQAMLGHSIGELVAAAVSGMLALPDALSLVAARAAAMQRQPRGAMLAVLAGPDEVADLNRLAGCELAALNGPEHHVLAGAAEQVTALEDACIAAGVACQRLATSHAFHTSSMEAAARAVEQASAPLVRAAGEIPVISNRSGRWVDERDLTDSAYWGDHLRRPVQFHAGVVTVLDAFEQPIFVEVGPGRALGNLIGAWSGLAPGNLVATLPHGRERKDDLEALLHGVGLLWAQGVEVDWAAMHPPGAMRRIALPTYPFERRRFWIDPHASDATRARDHDDASGADASGAAALPMRREPDDAGRRVVSFTLHDRLWFADEHRIFDDGAAVLPGTACLELVRRAYLLDVPVRRVALREVYFPAVLRVPDGGERRARVVFEARAGGTAFALESADPDGRWVPHAQGNIEDAPTASDAPAAPSELCERLGLSVVDDASARFAQAFADYGPRWRAIDAVWLGAGAGLARLVLPDVGRADLPAYALHPALLDLATAFLPVALRPGDASVPFRYASLELHRPLRATCYSLAVETAPQVFDVTVFAWDEAAARAERLVEIRGFARRAVASRGRDVARWCRRVEWRAAPAPGDPLPPARWLVFGDAWLASAPAGSMLVRAADAFGVSGDGICGLRPGSRADCERLVAWLAASDDARLHVVYGWEMPPGAAVDAALASLMVLLQALGAGGRDACVSLVTRGVRKAVGLDACVGAALAAALKAVSWEYPHLVCRHIDVEDHDEATVAALRAELASAFAPTPGLPAALPGSVTLAQGRREVAHYPPLPAVARREVLRDAGVYLITGGASGIGLELASHIATRCRGVRLALLSRTPHDDAAARFAALEAAGASVLCVTADVADAAQLADALGTVRARFGRIDGVVHAAGVEASGLIETGTPAAWRRVLAAKTDGARHLFEHLAEAPPDFVLLCSSLAAVAGGLGQADYAAANAYLDALARYWRQRGVAAISVNWDAWAETGMARAHALRQGGAAAAGRALPGLGNQEGCELFELALAYDAPQLIVSKTGFDDRHAPIRRAASGAATGSDDPRQTLVALWQELLGVETVEVDDDFFALGGHSLLATQLITRVRDQYARCPTLGEFLEEPTIARLLRALDDDADAAADADDTIRYCIVPMRKAGTRAPFFCIPGMGGNITQLLPLANALDADRPVIGLQYLGLDGLQAPHASVEQIASHYVRCIRSVQPNGPYHLGGHSLGGKIAYEMARQLHAAGETLGLVAMFDSAAPPYSPMPRQDDFAIASMILGVFAYYSDKMAMVSDLDEAAWRRAPRERLLTLLSERLAQFGVVQAQSDASAIRGLFNVYRAAADFSPLYDPPREPLPIPVLLFKATESLPDGIHLPEIRDTPAWGWERFTRLPVRSCEVGGNHYSCLMSEHVDAIAAALRAALTATERTVAA